MQTSNPDLFALLRNASLEVEDFVRRAKRLRQRADQLDVSSKKKMPQFSGP